MHGNTMSPYSCNTRNFRVFKMEVGADWATRTADVEVAALCEGLNATILAADADFGDLYHIGDELGRGDRHL